MPLSIVSQFNLLTILSIFTLYEHCSIDGKSTMRHFVFHSIKNKDIGMILAEVVRLTVPSHSCASCLFSQGANRNWKVNFQGPTCSYIILCFRKPLALLIASFKPFSYLAYSSNPDDGHVSPKHRLTFNRQQSIICVGTSHSANQTTPTVQQEQAIFIRYSLQSGRWDTHTSATQPALIAETPVLTGLTG
jgi:hypothetical protein